MNSGTSSGTTNGTTGAANGNGSTTGTVSGTTNATTTAPGNPNTGVPFNMAAAGAAVLGAAGIMLTIRRDD